jgi:ubiquinone/menaquinone biosynthesis C-methylase UbiE
LAILGQSTRTPSKSDPSRSDRGGDYKYKKSFYRDSEVAADYDFHRFGSPARQRRNEAKWAAIERGLSYTKKVRTVLDVPCGTGRFTARLAEKGYTVLGSDISYEMIEKASEASTDTDGVFGFVQADVERLPLRGRSADCIVCIRFMLHVRRSARIRILTEFRRVSRRWVIVDYRHQHTFRYQIYRFRRFMGFEPKRLPNRVARSDMEQEFRSAGLSVRKVIPVTRIFSDKWIVLAEAPSPSSIK